MPSVAALILNARKIVMIVALTTKLRQSKTRLFLHSKNSAMPYDAEMFTAKFLFAQTNLNLFVFKLRNKQHAGNRLTSRAVIDCNECSNIRVFYVFMYSNFF